MKDYNNNIVPADNDKATETRLQVADECLGDLIDWLQTGGGQVAILEFICNKPDIILANIRSVKISSPDVSF